jgi:hypothetical protein
MYKNIVACTGYGGTGSSAITDLFKEFDYCLSMGNEEFWFLQDYDGISDLEYFLIDGNHRSKASLAIKRYKDYAKNRKVFYDRFFQEKFIKYTDEYLNSIVESRFKKAIVLAEEPSSFKRLLYFKISPFLQILYKKIKFQYFDEFSPWFPLVEKCYAYPSEKKFSKLTKNYTERLFSLLDPNDQYQTLVIDQLVPAINIKRYFKYVDNLKVILVDRDPRDLYLLNKNHWKGASYICNTDNINEYIDWYKTLRIHRKNEDLINNNNIVVINFEELVYEYDNTLQKICDFLNIDIESHALRKKYFNPEISIINTKLWLKPHNYESEIKIIEKELSEFCYLK